MVMMVCYKISNGRSFGAFMEMMRGSNVGVTFVYNEPWKKYWCFGHICRSFAWTVCHKERITFFPLSHFYGSIVFLLAYFVVCFRTPSSRLPGRTHFRNKNILI